MKMYYMLTILLVLGSMVSAQTVRDFRLGVWGLFPWVNPNPAEQNYISNSNLNVMSSFLLNDNQNIYPVEYQNFYGSNFNTTDTRWLEKEWMNYFNSTGGNVGMYIGENVGLPSYAQSQIGYYATDPNQPWNNFLGVLSAYFHPSYDFRGQTGLNGYYVSHEDIRIGWETSHWPRVTAMCEEIRSQDPDPAHEIGN